MWYKVLVKWHAGGGFDMHLFRDSTGLLISSLSLSDSTFTGEGRISMRIDKTSNLYDNTTVDGTAESDTDDARANSGGARRTRSVRSRHGRPASGDTRISGEPGQRTAVHRARRVQRGAQGHPATSRVSDAQPGTHRIRGEREPLVSAPGRAGRTKRAARIAGGPGALSSAVSVRRVCFSNDSNADSVLPSKCRRRR